MPAWCAVTHLSPRSEAQHHSACCCIEVGVQGNPVHVSAQIDSIVSRHTKQSCHTARPDHGSLSQAGHHQCCKSPARLLKHCHEANLLASESPSGWSEALHSPHCTCEPEHQVSMPLRFCALNAPKGELPRGIGRNNVVDVQLEDDCSPQARTLHQSIRQAA